MKWTDYINLRLLYLLVVWFFSLGKLEVRGIDVLKSIAFSGRWRKLKWASILVVLSCTLLSVFQNCSPGFQVQSESLSSISSNSATCTNPINGSCVPDEVTHKMLIGTDSRFNVLARACLSCHDNANALGGLNLQNPTQASSKAMVILNRMKRVDPNLTPMPPSGSPTDDFSLALVEKWVASGAPVDRTSVRDAIRPDQYFSCQVGAQAPSRLTRLTKKQIENTLVATFGSTAFEAVREAFEILRNDTVQRDISDFQNLISLDQMAGYLNLAEQMAMYYRSDINRAASLVGNCIRTWPATAACRTQVVSDLGLRLFRRPLIDSERIRIESQVFDRADGGSLAVANIIYYFMISPDFLIHFEVGDPSQQQVLAANNTIQLTPYEVASKLSYFLWDGPPDSALFEAARTNQLATLAQVEIQVNRMLMDPRARAKVRDFYRYWLRPQAFDVDRYNADFLTGVTNLPQLNAELFAEMNEFLDYVTWTSQGNYKDLLTSTLSFARTPQASSVYGHTPAPVGSFATMGPGRKGLLMRAPVIANPTTDSNIIYRGVKIQTRFLCDSPGLPSGVALDNPAVRTDQARIQFTNRQRITQLTSSATCIGCHAKINPYGFLFENFDSLGRSRSQERSYSDFSRALLATHPVDTQVDRVFVDEEIAPSLSGSETFVDNLTVYNKAPACFVRQAYRYFHLRREDLLLDGCILSEGLVAAKGQNGDYVNASVVSSLKKLIINQALFSRRIQ